MRSILLLLAMLFAAVTPALAGGSGLPLPRFVSLRADEVNMRTGPGERYPVEWAYRRRDLPVEIVAEFEAWRRVRDPEGAEGWIHQSLLSGRRMVLVTGAIRSLRSDPEAGAAAIAMLEPGVLGRLLECPRGSRHCRVEASGFKGWLMRDEFWGTYPGEWID